MKRKEEVTVVIKYWVLKTQVLLYLFGASNLIGATKGRPSVAPGNGYELSNPQNRFNRIPFFRLFKCFIDLIELKEFY
jgi:hypothetical protein